MKFFGKILSSKRWLVWSAAVLIMGCSIYGILTLHRWSNASHRAVYLLSEVEGEANRISAIEWEAIARRALSPELQRAQQFFRQKLNRSFDELNRFVDARDLQNIRKTYHDYIRAIDEEFRLLEQGKFANAQRIDDSQVDPTYDDLIELIGQAQIRYEISSQWMSILMNAGSVASLILAALSIVMLFLRFEKLQRIEQLLLVEQNALRASEERFRSLVQNTSDIIAIVDPLPTKIKFISESIRRVLGHRPTDLIGSDFCRLIHQDDMGKMQRFLASCAFSSRSTHVTEVRLQHGGGQWAVVEIFGDNRVDDPAIGGIVLNFHDVSERQAAILDSSRELAAETAERKLH
jgi:PAS domain S-box-containing protein